MDAETRQVLSYKITAWCIVGLVITFKGCIELILNVQSVSVSYLMEHSVTLRDSLPGVVVPSGHSTHESCPDMS